MSFRFVPNSVTLDDLERRNSPNCSVISSNSVAFGTDYGNVVEDTPILSAVATQKFGEHRSSAGEFGRMFGLVRLGNMYSAELRQTFGVICGFAFAAFCARRWR